MIKLKKKIINKFGHDLFLLGVREDKKKVYLQDFSWDCNWYWGGGYLEVLNHNYTDINEHYHVDGLKNIEKTEWVNNKLYRDICKTNLYEGIKAHFKELVLTDDELWRFCDLMQSFYTLKEAAEWCRRGKSNYTSIEEARPRPEMEKYCNEIIEREIIPAIHKLLEI